MLKKTIKTRIRVRNLNEWFKGKKERSAKVSCGCNLVKRREEKGMDARCNRKS